MQTRVYLETHTRTWTRVNVSAALASLHCWWLKLLQAQCCSITTAILIISRCRI